MKKIYFLMLFVLMGFVADAQVNYLINPYYINTKQLLVDDSARISGATIVNGNITNNALTSSQQIGVTGSTTKSFAGAAGATDTMALSSTAYTWIKVRANAATDSLERISGGVTNALYIFQAVADDTTICFVDGGNLKLGGNRSLDALTDRLLLFFDGTNFIELFFNSND